MKYKLSNGKTYYADKPIIEVCAECSSNTNGIWGLYEHTGLDSCKYFLRNFTKTGKEKSSSQ